MEQTITMFISRFLVDLMPSNKALETQLDSLFKQSYWENSSNKKWSCSGGQVIPGKFLRDSLWLCQGFINRWDKSSDTEVIILVLTVMAVKSLLK